MYIFSDGYQDQFGGEENLKIGPKRLRDILVEVSGETMVKTSETLSNYFDNWKGNQKQMDDVLMIGIQV